MTTSWSDLVWHVFLETLVGGDGDKIPMFWVDKDSCWTRHRAKAFCFASQDVAVAVARRHPGSMVMCCFAPGAAPDERDGYVPKVREYEGDER